MANPSNLESRCLFHLSCHLEDYPLEALASLPLHLRRRLLLSLPAVDICQLEDTAVAEGTDMEASVWKELHAEDPRLYEARLDALYGSSSFKQKFLTNTVYCLFSIDIITAVNRLFAVHSRLRNCFRSLDSSLYPLGTPLRHIQSSTSELLVIQVLSALVNQCKCSPETMSFQCDCSVLTELFKRGKEVLAKLISSLLSEIKSLSFSGEANVVGCLGMPRKILESIFSQPKPMLTSLSVCGHPDFVLHTVGDTRVFFCKADCTQDKNYLQSLCPQKPSCSLPYSKLTSIKIGGNVYGYLPPAQQVFLHAVLELMVQYQSVLESVALSCFLASPYVPTLCTTLGRMFHEPQFRVLILEDAHLDWKGLNALIPPFLASPISSGHRQKLCILRGEFFLPGPHPSVDTSFNGCSVLPGKVLKVTSVHYRRSSPNSFLQWLEVLNIPGLLSSFKFENSKTITGLSAAIGTPMSLLKDENSVALLESFSIARTPLFHEASPCLPFNYLFNAQRLKKVRLSYCRISEDNLLPLLTQGLLKQVPHGVLEDLRLDGNELGDSSNNELQEFADAIFVLPQLTKLKLSLQINRLESHQFILLYNAWRRAGRIQMDTLDVALNAYEDHVSLLQEIAVNGDFAGGDKLSF